MASCLWHGADHNPSLMVHEDGFHCKTCGKRGSLAYLDRTVGSHFQLTRRQVSKPQLLPRWRSWEEKYGTIEGIASAAHKSLKTFPQFQKYYKVRKIDEFIEQGNFGYLAGWYTFPVYSPEHHIVDIVVRAGKHKNDARYVLRPDRDRVGTFLYSPSWDRVQQAEVIYVVYGIIDSWAMEALGLPCVTGTTGKSLSADQLKPLGKKFIIVPDDGEEREAYLLENKLGWRAEVKKLKYDDDCKDPDNVRVKFGNQYLLQLLGA